MIAFVVVYAGLCVLGLALHAAQKRWPSTSRVPDAFARARAADWQWWLVSPLFTGTLTRLVTWGALGSVAWALGFGLHVEPLLARVSLASVPLWAQVPLGLVVSDVAGYVSHRVRHQRGLWLFHAVHHSPTELDWLAAARMHPFDDVVDNTFVGVVVLLAGFDPRIFAFLGPALILHTMLIHADVAWDFGPLRLVVASPAYHRWHHALGHACNYAQLFPFVDALFGTLHLPRHQKPDAFGADVEAPKTLKGQLLWPFTRIFRE